MAQSLDQVLNGRAVQQQLEQFNQGRDLASAAQAPSLDARRMSGRLVADPTTGGARTAAPLPLGRLEQTYLQRLGPGAKPLRQFGYEALRAAPAGAGLLTGTVPEDYVLGIGDELVVTLRGQSNRTLIARVDREGRVVIDTLPPMAAAGRTFADFRAELEAQVSAAFLKTDVYISLGAIRSIQVLVTGEVEHPGQLTLTGFSTILDALGAAGGIRESGSIRTVALIRNGESQVVDLYGLLQGGASRDQRLQDGDRLIIRSLGATAAIQGDVNRPAIYELPAAGTLTFARLADYAGGFWRPSGNRLRVLRLDASGRDIIAAVSPGDVVRPNDILLVDTPTDELALEGAFEIEGLRSNKGYGSLAALLKTPDMLATDPYLPFAIVQSEEPNTRVKRYIPVDLSRVLAGKQDYRLLPRDRVIVFSRADIRYLSSADVQAVIRQQLPPSMAIGGVGSAISRTMDTPTATVTGTRSVKLSSQQIGPNSPETEQSRFDAEFDQESSAVAGGLIANVPGGAVETGVRCGGLRVLAETLRNSMPTRFMAASKYGRQEDAGTIANVMPCPAVFDKHPDLLPLLLEYSTSVEGAVRTPGIYPTLSGTSVETLARAAGGLTLEADPGRIEMTSGIAAERSFLSLAAASTVGVNPGDSIRFNQRATQQEMGIVTVRGEVALPGNYSIRRGERLSELLQRVGGLTQQAYPYGAVFVRERVKESEQQARDRLARELESSIPMVIASSSQSNSAIQAVPAIQALAQQTRNTPAVGRVVVEADPLVLATHPEMDLILEPGDKLVVPKRPSHVVVSGEVLNPGAVMFKAGTSAADYIKSAGGVSQFADESSAFIIYPNGEAQPLRLGSWTRSSDPIPPGAVIVMPRDPKPFDWMSVTRDISGIVRDLALSAASLAVISKD